MLTYEIIGNCSGAGELVATRTHIGCSAGIADWVLLMEGSLERIISADRDEKRYYANKIYLTIKGIFIKKYNNSSSK